MIAVCRRCSWLFAACVLASTPVLVGHVSPVQAEEKALNTQQARALFQEALALVAAGDYPNALGKLERVASFKRTPQVVFYIAVCHEKMGKLVMALGEYRIAYADAEAAGASDVVSEAKDAITALEPRIPTLALTKGEGSQAAVIRVDGKELGDAILAEPMPFDPGTRVIEASASGYKPYRREVRLEEGKKTSITVTLEPVSAAVAPPVTDGRPAEDKPDPTVGTSDVESASSSTLAWVSMGVGVVSLAASGFFYQRRSKAISDLDDVCGTDKDRCPASAQSTYDAGKRDTMIGNVALGVGVVGVVTGLILFASDGSSGEEPAQPKAASVRVTPSSQGAWAGMSLDGRF